MTSSAALLCLAMAVYHEARSEPLIGQQAVAHVVINRAHSGLYPDDVCAVLVQDAQFPFPWDPPLNVGAWERAVRVAEQALSGHSFDPTRGALHYNRVDVEVPWSTGMIGMVIGEHVFWTRGVN